MAKTAKRFVAAGSALVLMAGVAMASGVVTTKLLEAQYMDIKLVVSGREVTPRNAAGKPVEPFAVDGTVYLPVRAVGEALGKDVRWDAEANTVYVGLPPMEEDARQLIETLEQSHPAFALDAVPEGCQAAKEELLRATEDPECTLYNFTWAAMAYTASLGDEHTQIDPFGGKPQPVLDVGWVADGNRLYLTGEDGAVTATEVTAVGTLTPMELFAVIDRYVASENQAGRDSNHAQWASSPAMMIKAGAITSEENTVVLKLQEGKNQATRTVGMIAPESSGEEQIATRKMGNVFYVDFNQCVDGTEFQKAVSELRKVVENGVKKVIIDVRGNGGGNSDTCVQFLNAMDMKVPQYGSYICYSPLAKGTYPDTYEKDSGGERHEPNPHAAKGNPDVQLVILTDEDTFSSATMMGVYVQDGKLGTLIGRPSSNAPNSYGDILQFQPGNYGTYCTVSHKQWLRPDQSAKGNELTPDILTEVGEDALQVALDYLSKR